MKIFISDGFQFAYFSPEKIFSNGKLLKSGLPIRYSVYIHVRDLNWPTFHLKTLFQTENVSILDSPYDIAYILTCPGFKFANFPPENIISDGKLLKSGLPIRYSVYTHVRDLNWPTFHLKILIQTENASNLDSPYDITFILMSGI